jgi:hypothetical protein
LEPAQYLNFEVSGHGLPKVILGINRRTFNMNTRLNTFTFKLPLTDRSEHSIMEERYHYYRQVKEYTREHFQNFDPLISSFANKLI